MVWSQTLLQVMGKDHWTPPLCHMQCQQQQQQGEPPGTSPHFQSSHMTIKTSQVHTTGLLAACSGLPTPTLARLTKHVPGSALHAHLGPEG